MISIICPTNNRNQLNRDLIASLDKQTFKDYELIIIDTINKKYDSAIDALNEGVSNAKGEYLLFVHQDVVMNDEKELENIYNYICNIEHFGVVGIAGVTNKKNEYVGNITDGHDRRKISDKYIDSPTEVFSIDEVLFIIKKEQLEKFPFNKENKTWHLYAVEYSIDMHENNEKVYVIPSNIYHESNGRSMNDSYFLEIKRISKKYRKKYKRLNTAIRDWYTNPILLNIQILKYKGENHVGN